MTFKVVNQLNLIGAMKTFTKKYCNLCIQECLKILKKLRDKHFTVMNNNLEIYVAYQLKTTFRQFFLSTDDPFFNGWEGQAVKGVFKSYEFKPSMVAFE